LPLVKGGSLQITELLDEKEESEGQLRKVQGLLITLEADASGARTELQHLKEQPPNEKLTLPGSTPISPVSFKSFHFYLARHILSNISQSFLA
jgi:hypothetical protein